MNSQNSHPPKLAAKLLCWFLKSELAEEVLGDLDEQFYACLRKKTFVAARRNYWFQVFNYLRPFAIKNTRFNHSIQITMFKNNLKIAWRTLLKQKMYSSIKIGGFAIGIAACLLITLYIRHELSYDQHFEEKDRIFRLVKQDFYNGKFVKGIWFAAPAAKTLINDFPEIENAGRFNAGVLFGAGSNELRRFDQAVNSHEDNLIYADQSLFDILKLSFIYGDPKTALARPKTMIITKSKAEKYFGNEDPVGKQMIINNDTDNPFIIGGVIADLPENTHLRYDIFLTMTGVEFWNGEQNFWGAQNYPTYVLLKSGTDVKALEKKLHSIAENYYLPWLLRIGEVNAEESIKNISYKLQPITDIHLKSDNIADHNVNSDIRFVWLFGLIATFILVIASINFINLSTAKSANRAKEVGLRKVVGSYRINLIRQFLTESILYSFISFIVGILMASLLLPYFNVIADKTLTIPFDEWWFIPILFTAVVSIGVFSGLYPSFYLSGFKPIEVLKGKLSMGSKSQGLRSLLVVFQFTTSIVLIIGTVVIYQQVDYVLNKKLGFNMDQVLILKGTKTLADKIQPFKNELQKLADVQSAAIGDYLPVSGTKRDSNGFWKQGRTTEDQPVPAQFWVTDADYIETLGIEIVDGRGFSAELASDSSAIIINQSLAKKLKLDNPLGSYITNGFSRVEGFRVIGVVEDFHFESLKGEIEPLAMILGNSPGMLSVKVNTQDMATTVASITKVWDEFSPNQPIRMNFLDRSYELMYEDVKRSGYIFTSFAILAIIVACLGLFALSAFMVEQRTKEIGIRLVLGASVNSIFNLLTVNFMKLITISILIAMPISWYIMQNWLDGFEYRISITWDIFVIAGFISMSIAIATISFESVKAGMMNPAKSLRSE